METSVQQIVLKKKFNHVESYLVNITFLWPVCGDCKLSLLSWVPCCTGTIFLCIDKKINSTFSSNNHSTRNSQQAEKCLRVFLPVYLSIHRFISMPVCFEYSFLSSSLKFLHHILLVLFFSSHIHCSIRYPTGIKFSNNLSFYLFSYACI